jgi:hypothetical protein
VYSVMQGCNSLKGVHAFGRRLAVSRSNGGYLKVSSEIGCQIQVVLSAFVICQIWRKTKLTGENGPR